MSTQNPLSPQGSLLEQKAKRKTNLPVIVAVFFGIHVVVAGGIMMAGCKPEPKPEVKQRAPEPVLPPITPGGDLGSPVAPAPGTPPGGAAAPGVLPPIGSAPTPAPGTGAPGLAPLPSTPPVLAPATPPAPIVPLTPVPPAPAPEPPAAPAGEAKVHVVAKNDSFYTMGKKYGVTMKAIEAANPGVDSTKLKIGQKINIPAAPVKPTKAAGGTGAAPAPADADGTYTVKSGDNLGKIAKSHGTTVAKLREANGLKTDQIKVGQKLKVPAGGAKKPAEPAAGAAPAPRLDPVPALPPLLPPSGEPVSAPKL